MAGIFADMSRLSLKLPCFVISLAGFALLQGCAVGAVADTAMSTTVYAGKAVVKGTVGAGKLAYKGGKAVTGIGRGNRDEAYTGGPEGDVAPSCLEADGSYTTALLDANGTYYCPA